ncbi:hypothetical protein SAMN05421759_11382 [Roseivivax lentus]|uniref:Uncharacterized protein n=1 Tax=Roseivivax lentus TaxID=633194 RepID=A0A1N7P8F0_9RHOB|nr:hypothetical protein SAMN05421759_11382 [Roseivivax lentus]
MNIKVLGIGPGKMFCSPARLDDACAVVSASALNDISFLDFQHVLSTCVAVM